MILVDTHTHLYVNEFDNDRNGVIDRAIEKDVQHFFLPNIDHNSVDSQAKLCDERPGNMFPMIGLHPTSVTGEYERQINDILENMKERKYYGIGEIGLDLYWDKTFETEQRKAFRLQCKKAIELNLPVSIHMRNSYNALMEELKKLNDTRLRGIFHCFTGTEEQAREVLDHGFYLGIGGVLTFKNSRLDKEIQDIPLENLVLETDSPYLAPHPYRGKRNESSYLRLIARKLADVKGISIEEVAEKTTQNAGNIFRY